MKMRDYLLVLLASFVKNQLMDNNNDWELGHHISFSILLGGFMVESLKGQLMGNERYS